MKTHIRLSPEARRQLAEKLEVSDAFIYDAIYYRKNGPAAQRVRQAAIEMGGRYIDADFVPDCKTEYLEGQIRQTFAAGVVLTIDRKTGLAVISVGDDVVRRTDEPLKMSQWNLLAQEAQQLAVQRVITA